MITVLRYNELYDAGLARQIERTQRLLQQGDFGAAEVKKLSGTPFYRAKLTDADRLLFRFGAFDGRKCLLLLEVIRNHAYASSRFLNGAVVDESRLEALASAEASRPDDACALTYVNPRLRHFHLLDRILSFDDAQTDAIGLQLPLILIGSAGSGKTVLALEKLKQFGGDVLYVTLSPFLAENARNLYYAEGYDNESQKVDFLAYRELVESIAVPQQRPLAFAEFAARFGRRGEAATRRDAHRLYEEINGVLTGSTIDQPFLTREQYLELGLRQSIFLPAERAAVYDLFEQYLRFLAAEGYYNANILAFERLARVQPAYDYVVADEVQDLTAVQLHLALRTLRSEDSFILCGDANQVVHPNFFSWAHVKSLFYERRTAGRAEIIRVLDANYRNAPQVVDLANRLLLVKKARFGSLDRESNYLVRPVSQTPGTARLLVDDEAVRRDLNAKTSRSARAAVLVMREEDKADARRHFQTPLIFSIQEAKGLEYETVIALDFVSAHAGEFDAIAAGVTTADLQAKTFAYARAKDKTDKSLDAYKFYVNALYVAITRSATNLYLLERNPSHRLLGLLGLTASKDASQVKAQRSTADEWKEEARRLELQDRTEQAEQIRRVILAQKDVPWRVLTPHNLGELEREALDPERYNRQAKLLLFEYAAVHDVPYLLAALVAHKFAAALEPANQRLSIEHKYYAGYRGGAHDVRQKVEAYGVDFRNPLNQTPLMIAAYLGLEELARWLIDHGANTQATDNWGRIPLQIALRQAYRLETFAHDRIGRLYGMLAPPSLRLKVGDRLIKLDAKRMDYFLIHSMLACLQDILRVKIARDTPAFQTGDFVGALQHFPDHVIPPHRRQRTYLNAMLARNEVDRDDPYSRRLFVRVRRGYYVINPALELDIEGQWRNVYDLIHLDDLEQEAGNVGLKRFAVFVRRWREQASAPDRDGVA